MNKRIFRFSKDHCDWDVNSPKPMKMTLGGKGASLVEMSKLEMPVPPGFTITTEVCNAYRKLDDSDAAVVAFMDDLMSEVLEHMNWLRDQFGYLPLVSVRSGAPVSMPGMMDTILNVGLTKGRLVEWSERLNPKAAADSRRRLIQMMGSTAYGVDAGAFEFQLSGAKAKAGVKLDSELDAQQAADLCDVFEDVFHNKTTLDFPDTVALQLRAAIRAVFDSWMNPRAIEYRKINNLSEDMGTAVTVQAMVFGNMSDTSGSGVLFTRDPSTGLNMITGEFLSNAQGEDVVAGVRTPDDLAEYVGVAQPLKWAAELIQVCYTLENYYRDMADVEFTVQEGQLFILQSRVGKRAAAAAFKIAYDMVHEGLIDWPTALSRLTPDQFKKVRRPAIDPTFKAKPDLVGLPACPGVVSGVPVFSAEDAVNCTEPCILVRHETDPDDIAGMAKAVGILTATGGATSHAAVVARAMDKPAVVGATGLDQQVLKVLNFEDKKKRITIDGSTGRVWFNGDVPVVDSSKTPEVQGVMQACMDKFGGMPLFEVDPDVEPQGRYCISAANWWGEAEVLEAVLDGIEGLKHENIVLDLRTPAQYRVGSDALLEGVFGTDIALVHFQFEATDELIKRSKKLKGLVIVGTFGVNSDKLRQAGYVVPTSPTVVADLLQPLVGPPSDLFIQNIIGGKEAYDKLVAALKLAGHGLQLVPEAVPAEYAVFKVLSGAA